jgi:hypothetical protein
VPASELERRRLPAGGEGRRDASTFLRRRDVSFVWLTHVVLRAISAATSRERAAVGPPAWDRPTEGTLPAVVPVNEIVHRSGRVVAQLDHLRVYPNGFTINLFVLTNPHLEEQRPGSAMLAASRLDVVHRWPRIGVRFADGRTAGREATFPGHLNVNVAKDDRGIPTEPILTMAGGGCSSHGWHCSVWVFPLPPDGPLEVYVAFPAADAPESKVVLDGALVRSAAERARVIWS